MIALIFMSFFHFGASNHSVFLLWNISFILSRELNERYGSGSFGIPIICTWAQFTNKNIRTRGKQPKRHNQPTITRMACMYHFWIVCTNYIPRLLQYSLLAANIALLNHYFPHWPTIEPRKLNSTFPVFVPLLDFDLKKKCINWTYHITWRKDPLTACRISCPFGFLHAQTSVSSTTHLYRPAPNTIVAMIRANG